MSQLLRSSEPVARKPHRCGWCATTIRAGVKYRRLVLLGDDGLYEWIECVDCAPLVSPAYDWSGGCWADGITEEEMQEWAREHRTDETWGAQAEAFLTRWNKARGW